MIYTQSFPIHFDPVADPDAVVRVPFTRFTLLTSRLLRLEYDPFDQFEDRPSQAFWYRRQPVPKFRVNQVNGVLYIENDYSSLRYEISKLGFTPETLSITSNTADFQWRYGDEDSQNLLGTARTLDNIDGALSIEDGLISRSGWAIYDDSQRLVFNPDGWLVPRQASPAYKDLYFFGYGHDFNACLSDFRRVAGSVPLLPRWALGNWWSRYWAYSADELLGLMDEFKTHHVPLSVCIVDMDWHITDTGNTSSGWTGYTWNRELFPDPPAFLQALHNQGLKTALNLHPAEGVHPHEEAYPAMAERLGIDPESKEPIRFGIADPDFTRAYFEILHHPLETQGVDFWWLDWQQGTLSGMPGLDPLWWLNHLHYYDLSRDGQKRSIIFSRWGGLGNHRYPIGFSGDTHVTWESLAFQPYFTATASNVGYSWWSHDIGGHMSGVEDPELYARWVQFGLFSPILRLHSTNNPFHERRPWGYDSETEKVTRQAMQLRHSLIPYLYSMAWRDHHQALSIIRPMYHEYTQQEEAYHCPDQYWFGSELVVAPFLTPIDEETRLSRQLVWLPDGEWYDFFNGDRYPGGWHAVYGALEHIPVFAKAGAILPLAPRTGWDTVDNPESLEIHLFPGADNSFELYEDDNADQYSLTPIQQQCGERTWTIQVGPVSGDTSHLPDNREISLNLRAVDPNLQVAVYLNGEQIKLGMHYDEQTSSLKLPPLSMQPKDRLEVIIHHNSETSRPDYRISMLRRLVHAFRMESWAKMSLDAAIPAILEAPQNLADFELSLTQTQMRAMLEVICSAGLGRMPLRYRMGEETILWNNYQNADIRYKFVANNLGGQITHKEGTLPKYALLDEQQGVLHFINADREKQPFTQAIQWLQASPARMEIQDGGGIDAVVQLNIQGSDGFQSYWIIQEGRALKRVGRHKRSHATLEANSSEFLRLANGEVSPIDLYESGVIHVEGNLDLLLAFYRSIQEFPTDYYQAHQWRLEVYYLDILRLVL